MDDSECSELHSDGVSWSVRDDGCHTMGGEEASERKEEEVAEGDDETEDGDERENQSSDRVGRRPTKVDTGCGIGVGGVGDGGGEGGAV